MQKISTFVYLLKNSPRQILPILGEKIYRPIVKRRAFYGSIRRRIVWRYRFELGERPNLRKPVKFTEKAQWRKLYCPNIIEMSKVVDKQKSYNYVKSIIDDEHLLPALKIISNEITASDILALGDEIVIQPTHRSGQVYLIESQSSIDQERIAEELNAVMRWPYTMRSCEPWYGRIERAAIVKKLIRNSDGSPYLNDFKVHVFAQPNGKAKLICEVINTYPSWRAFFDGDFHLLDFGWDFHGYPKPTHEVQRPEGFEQMIEYATILAKPFDYARVDFMLGAKEFYFTEITFAPAGGLPRIEPPEMDEIIGSWWHLDVGNPLKRAYWFARTWLPMWKTERPMRNIRRLYRYHREWNFGRNSLSDYHIRAKD